MLNLDAPRLAVMVRRWPDINHLHMLEIFVRRLVPKEATSLCELSLTLTNNGSIMLVLEALNPQYSTTCQAASLALMDALSKPSKSRFNKVIKPAAFLAQSAVQMQIEGNKTKGTKQKDQVANKDATKYEQSYENEDSWSEKKNAQNVSGGVRLVSCLSAVMGVSVVAAVILSL